MNVSLDFQSEIVQAEHPDHPEHPGFTRMLLVDTNIFKGMIGEVPLDDNVLITGTNAAGKTSVIQTLPLGFGLSPQKLSSKAQDKTFFGHYLPRATSYIAFEYRNRMGDKRAVIMHLAASEEKIVYRFVRSELFENMFVTDEDKFVEFSNLATHLRDRGYNIASRQITTQIEYQTIIQGLPIENSRRNNTVQLQADYALAPPRAPLRNVENIIFSMLRRNGSLRALEDMVAEQVLKGEQQVRIGGKREDLANWPKRFRSYRDVMAKEDDVMHLTAKNTLLKEANKRFKETLAEMQGLQAKFKEQERALGQTLDRHEADLQQEEEAHTKEKQKAERVLLDARGKFERSSKDFNDLVEKHAKFMKDGIEEKKATFDRLPELENAARQVEDRLASMKGKLSDLTGKYDTMKGNRRDTADADLRKISRERKTSEQERPARRKAIEERRQESRARARKDYAPQLAAASETFNKAIAEVGAAEESVRNPSVDSIVIQRLEDARKDVDAHRSRYNEALKNREPLQTERTAVVADVKKADDEIDRLSLSKSGIEKKREALELSRNPSDGTLLAFLRQQRPDWGDTIGRILREDLLVRTDLGPKDSGLTETVFGIDLDLTDVEPLQQSDLNRIRINIDQCTAKIGELNQNLVASKKERDDRSAQLRGIRKKLSEFEADAEILERKLKDAEDYLGTCTTAHDAAVKNAGQAALRRLEDARKERDLAEAEKNRLETGLENDLAGYNRSFRKETDAFENEVTRETQAFSDQEDRIRKTRDDDLKTFDEECAEVLRNKGVDPETLQNLENEARMRRDQVTNARSLEKQVVEWRVFLADDWSRVDACRTDVENHRVTEHQSKEALDRLVADWMQRRIVLKREIRQNEDRLSALRRNRIILDNCLLKNADKTIESVHTIKTVDMLISALNEAERERDTLTGEIRVGVKDIARVFLAESDSPPAQHLKLRMQAFESVIEGPEWLPAFEEWFSKLHEHHRDTLRNDGHSLAEDFKNKYQMLKRTDERIDNENRLLQRSLNQNIAKDVVDEIQIRIESGIKELEFLPALARLADLHEAWTRSSDNLPSDAFTEALSALLEYWSGNDGITADLRQQIRLKGHVVENGIKRNFHASTDLADISSNGVSYLILTTILVGFINIVRGKEPVRMVWALDELGNIDTRNVRNLLKMLNDNKITLISATPNADTGVRDSFAHRFRIKKDEFDRPRLINALGAEKRSHTLVWSRERQAEIQAEMTMEMQTGMQADAQAEMQTGIHVVPPHPVLSERGE